MILSSEDSCLLLRARERRQGSKRRGSTEGIIIDTETTRMTSEDTSGDGETTTRGFTEAADQNIGDIVQIHIQYHHHLPGGETVLIDPAGDQRHQRSVEELERIETGTMIDGGEICHLSLQDLHLQVGEEDYRIEEIHIQTERMETAEVTEVMEMVDTTTEEMEMAMVGETTEDHLPQEEGRNPQKTSRPNVNANWQLCSKMHRA